MYRCIFNKEEIFDTIHGSSKTNNKYLELSLEFNRSSLKGRTNYND